MEGQTRRNSCKYKSLFRLQNYNYNSSVMSLEGEEQREIENNEREREKKRGEKKKKKEEKKKEGKKKEEKVTALQPPIPP